ncbi:MAG: AAA family ATPase [Bacteroidales bacterium]|nr:AAA family ATPase [Bacteroidales bacterium]
MKIDTNTPEFQAALNMIRFTHHSVFLTGRAGTGKSTFLKYVRENTRKKCVVLAPTGIAAINAGGVTLHSFFKLPFHPLAPDDTRYAGHRIREFLKYGKEHIKLLQSLELIIIDEISMVRADLIDFIDRILRTYTTNHREPFGGKQMLFIGDVFQLEPVVKADERDILSRFYPSPYFFSARVFRQMELVSIELTKVYRQHDTSFISLLDRIRTNTFSPLDLSHLNKRVTEAKATIESPSIHESEERYDNDYLPTRLGITLCARRDDVDFINDSELNKLDGEVIHLHGTIRGDFPASSLPTLLDLDIKLGAQIIFVKNDQDKQWVNGTLGVITGFSEEPYGLIVITEEGKEVIVEEAQWANMRYTYDEKEKKIQEEQLGTFTQFPIRLAWAITIHKSQGLTFERVNIDFGTGTFAGGQAYVALSRCTSLEGITLKKPLNRSDVFVRQEVVDFAKHFNNKQSFDRALKAAKADIEYTESAHAFEEGRWDDFLHHFFTAIHARYDIEKPLAQRLIRRKLSAISRMKAENEQLKKQLTKRNKMLQQFAKEYYLMGNDCISEAKSYQAARRNYEKAVALWPEFEAAHKRLGDCLDHEGMKEEARKHWKMAEKLRKGKKGG